MIGGGGGETSAIFHLNRVENRRFSFPIFDEYASIQSGEGFLCGSRYWTI